MTITDPIADMLTRIRNSIQVDAEEVLIPYSKIKHAIAKILSEEGFIKAFEVVSSDIVKKQIRIELKYTDEKQSVISYIQRVSRSSKRSYLKKKEIKKVLGGLGISIYTTSKGLMTGKEARLQNIGGECLLEVY